MKKWTGMLFALCAIISLILSGCASKQAGTGDALKVGTDAQFPPFEKQEGDGRITGFDADLLQAIAKAGGFKADLQHTGWDPMFEGIDRGKLDAGIGGITITEERKKKYDFTEPYFEATQVILVPNSSSVKTLKELNGKKIGVQSATTGEKVVQDAFGKTYAGLKGYDDLPSAVEDLKLGRLDAVVADNAVVMEYVKKLGNSQFKIVEDPSIPKEQYGLIVKKGNKKVLDQLNAGLKKIREDGTYDKIYEKYFGKK
ncbi:basic amino acid ABC transporter substrate-binding protein [Lihuaxuella thermophila]|uniref:Polar amino acid transport system substrate-binding protein n=1 Tax=Lihuaxuella thermophila TaxID=1173111 RepID=A0A1H8B6K8_9BACL|nr:basic amino acid ABC transporter substrate-binding protein [Lihuaxuella thermophila]SEM78492.1 polar amino acid transport system substrate-binding protein [Lihuaxuella thermophila]